MTAHWPTALKRFYDVLRIEETVDLLAMPNTTSSRSQLRTIGNIPFAKVDYILKPAGRWIRMRRRSFKAC